MWKLRQLFYLLMGCSTSLITDQPQNNIYQPSNMSIRSKKHVIINQRMFPSNPLSENVYKSHQSPTQYDHEILKYFLRHHYLFSSLKESQRQEIAQKFQCYQGKMGTNVINKGDTGALFFYIQEGTVSIELPDNKSIALGKGQSFGQLALLYKAPRSASVKCQENCLFFCLHHSTFRSALQRLSRRQFQVSKKALDKIHLFHFLSSKQKVKLAHNMYKLHFEKGDTIFNNGDEANAFYIIGYGKVQIDIPLKQKIHLKNGESFGQNCFKQNEKRSGDAICVQKTEILALSRNTMIKCLGSQLTELYFFSIMRWSLRRVSIFKGLALDLLDKIISESKVKKLKEGQYICKQGDSFLFLVVCLQGQINGFGVGTLFNAEYLFQEKSDQKIIRNVRKYDQGNVCIIQIKKLKSILGNNFNQIYKSMTTKEQQKNLYKQQKQIVRPLLLNDFQVIKKIGQGQFGKVYVVQDSNKNQYVLKSISKYKIIEYQMSQLIINEKQMLTKIQSPFIVKCLKTLKDQHNVFFLMNYIEGKDFYNVLLQIGICDHKKAKFYLGCVILALQYIHSKSIIYRDLKTQNCVIDHDGYINLVDLGTARQLKAQNGYRTFTVIGTPHYMAPEIIQGKGYSFSADIWSLGIFLYQMVCGKFPFGQKLTDPYQIYRSVIETQHIRFPNFYSFKQGRQLICTLLNKSELERQVQDFNSLKSHAFFRNFNWDFLQKKKIASPYSLKVSQSKQKQQKRNEIDINMNAKEYFQQKSSGQNPVFFDWEKQF